MNKLSRGLFFALAALPACLMQNVAARPHAGFTGLGAAADRAATADTNFVTAEGDVDQAQDDQMEAAKHCRITPSEIDELVQFHSLESLVKNLIQGRRLMNGEFWELSHYDL